MRKLSIKQIVYIGALFFILVLFWFVLAVFTPQGAGENVVFRVSEGDSLNSISEHLAEQGLVESRFGFWFYTLLSGQARVLKAGEYEFALPVSIREVALIISNGGGIDEIEVVIPEGFTIEQIEERLNQAGLAGARKISSAKVSDWQDDFSFLAVLPAGTKTLEGFLFPDTYRFKPYATTEVIITKLFNNFEKRTKKIWEESEKRGMDFYDILIMASILEREVPLQDMSLVAGILWKRLKTGIPLQADATLIYVLGRFMVRSDTENLNSPYNTYKYVGLPPTPISNPGLQALEAALNPKGSDYWYYLSRSSDGSTIFSRTLEEHNEARARYLR